MKTLSHLAIALRFLSGRGADRGDLARRSLRGAIAGIAVSLIPIVVVLVVADGMIQGITARFIETGTYHKQIIPYQRLGVAEADSLAAKARQVDGVTGAWVETQAFGVAFAQGISSGVAVRAVAPTFFSDSGTARFLSVDSGDVSTLDSYGAFLGKELAHTLGVGIGQTVNLITLRSRNPSDTGLQAMVPRVSVFVVRAIVSSGYRELDENWLFIHPRAASRAFSPTTARTIVGVKVADPYRALASPTERAQFAALRSVAPDSAAVYDWRDLERSRLGSLNWTRSMLLIIMALVILVASINVGSALVTLVMERSNEVAIMKSFGASGADISAVFVMVGAVIGVAGALIGVAAGTFVGVHVNEVISALERLSSGFDSLLRFALNQSERTSGAHLLNPDYYLENIPIILDYPTLALIACGTVLMSIVASVLPARKAGTLRPLELLRRH